MSRFAGDGRYVFPRRHVTRPADAAVEDHESLDRLAFDALAGEGAFALMWEAHGHKYGVTRDIDAALGLGRIVAVNVSRTIIGDVARRYQNAVVVEIAADPSVRAARLAARGRETGDDILLRTRREVLTSSHPLPVRTIKNEGDVAEAGEEFCGLLEALS
jgi:ribose 1,5-bisphosphokinase